VVRSGSSNTLCVQGRATWIIKSKSLTLSSGSSTGSDEWRCRQANSTRLGRQNGITSQRRSPRAPKLHGIGICGSALNDGRTTTPHDRARARRRPLKHLLDIDLPHEDGQSTYRCTHATVGSKVTRLPPMATTTALVMARPRQSGGGPEDDLTIVGEHWRGGRVLEADDAGGVLDADGGAATALTRARRVDAAVADRH
jgi:hypothetical protein